MLVRVDYVSVDYYWVVGFCWFGTLGCCGLVVIGLVGWFVCYYRYFCICYYGVGWFGVCVLMEGYLLVMVLRCDCFVLVYCFVGLLS